MDPFIPGSLEEQVAQLRHRVLRLERLLAAHGIVDKPQAATVPQPATTMPPSTAAASPAPPAPAPAFVPRSIEPPRFASAEPERARPAVSMESRIGSQWF